MIADKDRSFFIGASDTDKVIGNWGTKTFEKWWMQKLGINRDTFSNKFTDAGTHYEHKILEPLGIPMEFDKQVIIGRLRVNLDGNTDDCIFECKTYQFAKGFKLPQKYINQVQVQMYSTGIKRAKIVVYGLVEGDYDNYFHPIDKSRLMVFDIEYDEKWINKVFLPRFRILEQCLIEGRFPICA
jgi:hypothetical protein